MIYFFSRQYSTKNCNITLYPKKQGQCFSEWFILVFVQRLGSVRGEDMTYITGLPLVGGAPYFPHNFSRQDMGVSEAVLNFFCNFAKSGDPNEPRAHLSSVTSSGSSVTSTTSSDHGGSVKERTRYRALNWDTYEPATQLYLSISKSFSFTIFYQI